MTPACSNKSALPLVLEALLFPCFATLAPAAAARMAALVETLNKPDPSPPVPQVSTRFSILTITFSESSLMTSAAPITSSTVSPLIERETRKADICESAHSPVKICLITDEI